LSTLTKILIVILTLSSIFLCGTVVTYVSNADNWRDKYKTLKSQYDSAVEQKKSALEELKKKKKQFLTREGQLNEQINSLKTQLTKLTNHRNKLQIEKTNLENKVQSWVSITNALTKTTEDQTKLINEKLEQLKEAEAQRITLSDKLKDTEKALIEKLAIIETVQAEKKRLKEEKTKLQQKLNRILGETGLETAAPEVVTPKKEIAKPIEKMRPAPTKPIGLRGKISLLDLQNSIAQLSIGSANGVRKGMKFYVTRADQFICEILIIDVEPESSVGILERLNKQNPPKTGDSVATNI